MKREGWQWLIGAAHKRGGWVHAACRRRLPVVRLLSLSSAPLMKTCRQLIARSILHCFYFFPFPSSPPPLPSCDAAIKHKWQDNHARHVLRGCRPWDSLSANHSPFSAGRRPRLASSHRLWGGARGGVTATSSLWSSDNSWVGATSGGVWFLRAGIRADDSNWAQSKKHRQDQSRIKRPASTYKWHRRRVIVRWLNAHVF